MKSLSRVRLLATPWTVAYQPPSSMEFSRQEYWSGLPFLSPGDLPDPGIEPGSPALQADALPYEPPGKPYIHNCFCVCPSVSMCVCVYMYIHIYIHIYIYMYTHTHTHTHTH